MPGPEPLDEIDHKILGCLRENARDTNAAIAKRVHLTAQAVGRRIDKLEALGVIRGYTVALGHDKVESSIEAFVELSFAGDADVHEHLGKIIERPEVRDAMTITGPSDAFLRVRVRNLAALRNLVMELRTSGPVTGTHTRVVLGRHWHGEPRPNAREVLLAPLETAPVDPDLAS